MKALIGYNLANFTTAIKTNQDDLLLLGQIPEGGTLSGRFRFDAGESPDTMVAICRYLRDLGRNVSIIFQASDDPAKDNIAAIKILRDGGCTIKAAEYVNEPFYPAGGYNFDFTKYSPGLDAFCKLITANFPGMRISIPVAPRAIDAGVAGGSSNHKKWNDAVFQFIKDHPLYPLAVSIHIYFNSNEIPALGSVTTDETGQVNKGTFPLKRVYNYAQDLQDEDYWKAIYDQADPHKLFDAEFNYLRSRCDVPIYVTELGIVNTGALNGSYTYSAIIWRILMSQINQERVEDLDVHAGPSASTPGAICPRKAWDVRDKDNLNNVTSSTWDAVTMALMASGTILPYSPGMAITQPGIYSLWFDQPATGDITVSINASGLKIDSQVVYGISGKHYSSLSRNTEATTKGSVLSIDEVTGIVQGSIIKSLSFGFIQIAVSKPVVTVFKGCTDPTATNYNPLATQDDGSCTYPPPPPPPSSDCTKCKGWLYRFFHPNQCKNCK